MSDNNMWARRTIVLIGDRASPHLICNDGEAAGCRILSIKAGSPTAQHDRTYVVRGAVPPADGVPLTSRAALQDPQAEDLVRAPEPHRHGQRSCPPREAPERLGIAVESENPGDHWHTDLITWGLPVFGEPVDGLLREVFGQGGAGALDGDPSVALIDLLWPSNGRRLVPTDTQLDHLAAQLTLLLDSLRRSPSAQESARRSRWRWPGRPEAAAPTG
ncbi:MAG: hypothetical protein Q8R60_08865 [Mycobacteriales bacterium]|nr:hypothetical protein [Mycobacteriales bacterium]